MYLLLSPLVCLSICLLSSLQCIFCPAFFSLQATPTLHSHFGSSVTFSVNYGAVRHWLFGMCALAASSMIVFILSQNSFGLFFSFTCSSDSNLFLTCSFQDKCRHSGPAKCLIFLYFKFMFEGNSWWSDPRCALRDIFVHWTLYLQCPCIIT